MSLDEDSGVGPDINSPSACCGYCVHLENRLSKRLIGVSDLAADFEGSSRAQAESCER